MKIIYGMGAFEVPLKVYEEALLEKCAENNDMSLQEYIRESDVALKHLESRQHPNGSELSIWNQASPKEQERLLLLMKRSAALREIAEIQGVEPGEYIAEALRHRWRFCFPLEAAKSVFQSLSDSASAASKNEKEFEMAMNRYGLKVSGGGQVVLIPPDLQPELGIYVTGGEVLCLVEDEHGKTGLLRLERLKRGECDADDEN